MMACRRRAARGFSLLEMAMVLVIIGVVMGAVTVGSDVLRQAKGQQAYSVFVSGWRTSFFDYFNALGALPRDTNPPQGLINAVTMTTPPPRLCGMTLSNVMLVNNIRIPQGRGLREETNYLYQDSNGAPHVLTVCFQTLVARPGGAAGNPEEGWAVLRQLTALGSVFRNVNRHVMVITGLTVELATQMDVLIDGSVNPQMGQFRMREMSNLLVENPNARWGNVRANMNSNESAHVEVTAFFEMF